MSFWFAACGLTYDVFLGPVGTAVAEGQTPRSMQLAMALSAACCLLIGLFPHWLYRYLPFDVDYHAYTVPHVVEQLQLMVWAAIPFVLSVRFGWYRVPHPGTLLDVDWCYREPLPAMVRTLTLWSGQVGHGIALAWHQLMAHLTDLLRRLLADDGRGGRFPATGQMAMWAAVMLVIYLLLNYR